MSFVAHNIDIEYNGKKYHLDSADVLFGHKKELRGMPETWVKKIGSIGSVDYDDYPFKSIELFVVTRDSSSVHEDTMLAVIKPQPRKGFRYSLAYINGKERLSQILKDLKVSDSRKIKDASDTPLNGILSIAFNDGTEQDMCNTVKQHANEQGEIDGVQYETYETDEQDGVAFVDLCAIGVSDATEFVKALLKKWGVLENTADIDFDVQTEEEYKEEQGEEVSDSRKVKDSESPDYIVYDLNVNVCSFDNKEDAIEFAKDLYSKKKRTIEVEEVYWDKDTDAHKIVWSSDKVKDSKVNDMTKPIRWKAYAERVRAKRQNKNAEPDEPETEKQDVADSRRVRDMVSPRHFSKGNTNGSDYCPYVVFEDGEFVEEFYLEFDAVDFAEVLASRNGGALVEVVKCEDTGICEETIWSSDWDDDRDSWGVL